MFYHFFWQKFLQFWEQEKEVILGLWMNIALREVGLREADDFFVSCFVRYFQIISSYHRRCGSPFLKALL